MHLSFCETRTFLFFGFSSFLGIRICMVWDSARLSHSAVVCVICFCALRDLLVFEIWAIFEFSTFWDFVVVCSLNNSWLQRLRLYLNLSIVTCMRMLPLDGFFDFLFLRIFAFGCFFGVCFFLHLRPCCTKLIFPSPNSQTANVNSKRAMPSWNVKSS